MSDEDERSAPDRPLMRRLAAWGVVLCGVVNVAYYSPHWQAALWTPEIAMVHAPVPQVVAVAFSLGVAMGVVGMGLTLLFARRPLDVVSGAIISALVIGALMPNY